IPIWRVGLDLGEINRIAREAYRAQAVALTQPINYEQHDPDVRLMLQVRRGDAAAFEELVRRYRDRLLTILEHLVGHREQAEDLAQDVFVRVFKARERYTPDRSEERRVGKECR